MIITIIEDGQVVKEITSKDIYRKILKQLVLTAIFAGAPKAVLACTPYNSPNYLKSEMILWLLQHIKAEELIKAMEDLDKLPVDVIKALKTLRSYKTRLL